MADTTVLVMMVGSWVLYAVVSKIRGHRSSDDRDDPCRSHPGVVVGPILFISYSGVSGGQSSDLSPEGQAIAVPSQG